MLQLTRCGSPHFASTSLTSDSAAEKVHMRNAPRANGARRSTLDLGLPRLSLFKSKLKLRLMLRPGPTPVVRPWVEKEVVAGFAAFVAAAVTAEAVFSAHQCSGGGAEVSVKRPWRYCTEHTSSSCAGSNMRHAAHAE